MGLEPSMSPCVGACHIPRLGLVQPRPESSELRLELRAPLLQRERLGLGRGGGGLGRGRLGRGWLGLHVRARVCKGAG